MKNSQFEIGQSLVQEGYGCIAKTGYIAEIHPEENKCFTIGGNGMEQNKFRVVIAWENNTWNELSENNISRWRERAVSYNEPDVTPEAAAAMLKNAVIARVEAQQAERLKREQQAQEVSDWRDSIRDKVPADAKAVIIAEFEEDDSDSQTDYFNTKTTKTVILGFSSHARNIFSEMRKAAKNYEHTASLADAPKGAEHRQNYSMGGGYFLKASGRYSSGWKIRKVKFYGTQNDIAEYVPFGLWSVPEATQAAPATQSTPKGAAGVTIEQHTHTKKGFEMWIVCLADRVERETYLAQLADARTLGGWYSRKWGATPAGFAFKDEAKAIEFADSIGGEAVADETAEKPKAATSQTTAEKLDAIAEKLQSEIERKYADRAQNTPKQRKQAMSARQDGNDLQRAQKGLRELAAMHRAGTVPAVLASIKSKKAAIELAREQLDHSNCGYYDPGQPTGEPANDTDAARTFWGLAGGKTQEETERDEIAAREMKIKNSTIPGFFPTPADIVARMIDAADLELGQSILEPSAGSGAIAQAITRYDPSAKITCLEINASLFQLLKLKGLQPKQEDFMEFSEFQAFDRVLMNPPFEKGQDVAHVRRAFLHLKPGGVLVAIMAPSWQHNSARKFADFREWLNTLPHDVEDIGAGAFKASGTNVSTVMVTIRKPEASQLVTIH